MIVGLAMSIGLTAGSRIFAEVADEIFLYVAENVGIRRFFYPVDARVPFSDGELSNISMAELRREGIPVPATYTALSRWPDGSVQWLAINFNTSIGPLETQVFTLDRVVSERAKVNARRGLVVTDFESDIQVGRLRFAKNASPLIRSVDFSGEQIGIGTNGIRVTDRMGRTHGIDRDAVTFEIIREGQQFVEVRYKGKIELDSKSNIPFELSVGLPNSKSWFKATIEIDDPESQVSMISFHTPLSFGEGRLVWDFGTDRWTYGSLREMGDSVRLTTDTDAEGDSEWTVAMTVDGETSLYEVSAGLSTVSGWGHLQGQDHVVAFGIDHFGREPGSYSMAVTGDGQLSLERTVNGGAKKLTIYQHFVSVPVHVGAATSPMSMLNPLTVRCDDARYRETGLTPDSGRR